MGTPDFAVPCLEKIIEDGHNVCAVFCQPDRPKGRGHKLTPPPVKDVALKHKIPVFQPEKLKDNTEIFDVLKDLEPDCIVVVAYGKLLPKEILNLPKFGCINVHASVLPKYRGSAPIQWAVINGEKETGVTTMLLDEGMDTGDILLVKKCNVPDDMTGGELFDVLSPLGAELLAETLECLKDGSITPVKQNEEFATRAPMLDKSISVINWNKSAEEIHNLIRGLNPWPVALTYANDMKIKVYSSHIDGESNKPAGTVIGGNTLKVVCGDNKVIELIDVQLDGSRRMNSADMLRGHKIEEGEYICFYTRFIGNTIFL